MIALVLAAAAATLSLSPQEPGTGGQASLAQIFSADDYPIESVVAKEEGSVLVRYVVAPTGDVAECKVERSSGHASLDQQTCDIILARARFTPARDEAGKAVAESRTQRVHWQLPEDEPQPLVDSTTDISITAGPDGRPVRCQARYVEPGNPSAEQPDAYYCAIYSYMFTQELGDALAHPPGEPDVTLLLSISTRVGTDPAQAVHREEPGKHLLRQDLLRLHVSAEGRVDRCAATVLVGPEEGGQGRCEDIAATRFIPPRGKSGRFAASEATMLWSVYILGAEQ